MPAALATSLSVVFAYPFEIMHAWKASRIRARRLPPRDPGTGGAVSALARVAIVTFCPRSQLARFTPINHEYAPGYKVGFTRSQITDHGTDFVDRAHSPDRYLAEALFEYVR